MVNGNANAIQLRNETGCTEEIEAIAMAFGPVPIGVAMPPKSAPKATAKSSARRIM